MNIDELVENFELLGPWEERYRYLIDIGRKLPPMSDAAKNETTRVRGCMSQVWLDHELVPGEPERLKFYGDSDAHIVKGLIALLFMLVSERTPEEILNLDIAEAFARLGLENQITMNRRNGFYSMVERIRAMAAEHAGAA